MITIGYCTRVSNENFGKHLIKSCGLDHKKIQIIEIVNTGNRSLTNCYNEILKNAKYNHVVFTHSDITIETKQWGSKLLKLFEKNPGYGILGVAGTKLMPASGRWWDTPKKMYGRVAHTHEGKSWLSTYSADLGQEIEETVVVDGVFFAVDKTKLKKTFNEEVIGFHFYELTLCFENYLEGVKIGVTTMIRINHKSIGMTNEEWEKNRLQFTEKFKDDLPVSIGKVLRKGERLKIMLVSLSFDDTNPKSKLVLEIASKLKKENHDVTICSNVNGKIPMAAKQMSITLAPIQQPPGFALGDGKWMLKTQNGDVPSQEKTLYKVKEFNFDIIHTFDDEIIDHMGKLYGGTAIIKTNFPNGLFVSSEAHPLAKSSIELSNELKDVESIDVKTIIKQYVYVL